MKRYIWLLSLLFIACDDGDPIITNFNFSNETPLEVCQDNTDYVFHYIDSETNEAISFVFSSPDFKTSYEGFEAPEPIVIPLNTSNRLNYRTLSASTDSNTYFCQDIPPSSPSVLEEFRSTTGGEAVIILEVFEQDDDDGVPAELEDINGNGDLFDDDTDSDGIPNFLDVDDDNDNVLTEVENINDENNNQFPDTDGDGTPDYLDDDDDNDGVLTRFEDLNAFDSGNEEPIINPTDDVNADGLPNYLNPDISESIEINAVRANEITRRFRVQIVFNDVTLNNVNNDQTVTISRLNMGFIETTTQENLIETN